MTRGAFITLEGGEGVGKSTAMAAIEANLRRHDIPLTLTREPGGTPLGESVRSWILDGDHGALSPEVEALLMFAARAQHIEKIIRPAIDAGRWVICDRFTDATRAYQGGGRGLDSGFLDALVSAVQCRLAPDLTLLLDAPIEIGMARIAGRPHDHFEREESAFFERVRRSYLDLAAAEPERFRIIDASRPVAEVEAAIEHALEAFRQRFAPGTLHT
jgi:dTMP kinase